MSLEAQLDTLRSRNGLIESASYIDMRSGTVLYTSSTVRPPQERLDQLCMTATDILGGVDGEAAEAVSLKATEALILCRAPREPGEALCLVCAPDVEVGSALADARSALGGTDTA